MFSAGFEKTFDKVRRALSLNLPSFFSFGETFIKWMNVMYKQPTMQ